MSDTEQEVIEVVEMEEVNCAQCAIRFAVPKNLGSRRRNDGRTFWCPNGHGNAWPVPEKPRDDELEELRSKTREAKDALASERAAHAQTRMTKRPLLRRRA